MADGSRGDVLTELRLAVRHTGDGHKIVADTLTAGELTFDGDGGTFGASPMQHLLAALGACTLMDIAIILRKKRIAFADLWVEAIGTRPDEGHPKPFTGIRLAFHVSGDVPAKAFEDAVRLSFEKYCNVGATLRAGVIPTLETHIDSPPSQEA